MTAARAARLLALFGVLPLGAGLAALGARARGGAAQLGPRLGARLGTQPGAPRPAERLTVRPDTARLLADAREGTRRYQSQQAAVDDGFTRVGVEFPAMGEHWVSFARVMEGAFAADRPSILIYANGADGPRLSGVAYTALLTGNDRPPDFPSAGAWHEHSGGVAEESLPLRHSPHHAPAAAPAAPAGAPGADAPRLFVLHAWVWTPNPDGVFVTDNWALPFARHGVAAPAAADAPARDAARALALADDHDGYHRMILRSTLALSGREDSLAADVLARHQGRAERAARALGGTGRLSAAESGRLAAGWEALWADLQAALPARAAELGRLRQQM